MVSKRQKLARKKFKEENPELFPPPEPIDPEKKPKEKTKSKDPNKPIKKGFKKHPLRVPGMKPGESCFICKAKEHIAKHCPEKAQWERNKICLLCRHRGHSLKNCPNKDDETMDRKLCYNCGGNGHSLANCPQPLQDGGTTFAKCFICNETGHLSKNCPQNTHGIYPKGGCCKICGGITHLAKDCPHKGSSLPSSSNKQAIQYNARPRGQVTKFTSGDDLDDDFMVLDSAPKSQNASDPEHTITKSKKKQGPKVVNFVG